MSSQTTVKPVEAFGRTSLPTLTLTILFHPDVNRIGELALLETATTELARDQLSFSHPGSAAASPLADLRISRTPVRISNQGDGRSTITAAPGSLIANGRPVHSSLLIDQPELETGVVLELSGSVALLLHLRYPPAVQSRRLGLVGANQAIDELRRNILRVADLPIPVMIRGETGTGKELVARAIHAASARADRAFVSVNMSAIPASTAASELFGHTRGAFTGAVTDHRGYFGQADGGSLFLDEIGATPREIQPMLLRAVESHELQPLGSTTPSTVDTRLIAATDADLEKAISDESFRAALLHRLEGYQLFVPPLRHRRDDIGRLFIHFLKIELEQIGELDKLALPPPAAASWLPAAFVARLASLDWPGNVRQLKNAVRQLAISNRDSHGFVIDATINRLLEAAATSPTEPEEPGADKPSPGDIDEETLIDALRAHDWLPNKAAAQLGISRSHMYDRIKRSKRIRKAKALGASEILAAREACSGDLTATARQLEVSKRSLLLRMKELAIST